MGKTTLMMIRRFGQTNLPALVMLHGFLGSKDDWSILMPRLSQFFHCICIDLPGHGDNTLSLRVSGFEQTAQQILTQINQLGLSRFHLLGYSLGGRIALHIALASPESLLSLTLESAHPGLSDDGQRAIRATNDQLWADKLSQLPIAAFLSLWYKQPVFADLSLMQKQHLISLRSKNNLQGLLNCYVATSLSLQQDCIAVPQKLACPCHFIYGVNDDKFAKIGRDWQSKVDSTHFQLHPLAAAGHNIHSLHPDLFIDVLVTYLYRITTTTAPE